MIIIVLIFSMVFTKTKQILQGDAAATATSSYACRTFSGDLFQYFAFNVILNEFGIILIRLYVAGSTFMT